MKKIITNLFAKVAMVAGLAMVFSGNAFAQTWTHTFASPEAISNNSITVDGATWSIATTPGEGSPTMSTGNYSKTYGLKFGSSKSAYYGSVTFSTDYFSAYNVQSVSINVLNNGSKQGTLTAQQGSTSIGSKSQTFGQTWTDLTVNTNAGSGGSLSFTYSVQQAFYIHSITVVYTTGGGSTTTPSISADNVNITYDSTGGSIAYTVNDGVDGGSVTASTEATWLNLGSEASSPISFTCSANAENTSRSATVTLTYTYNTNETVTKDVTVTQAAAPVIYTTIPDLFNAATSTATNVLVTFNDWVVSGVSTNGKNVFVTDNNGNGFVIYGSDLNNTYSVGKILSGTAVPCSLKLYNGFAELVNLDAADLTITTGGTVSPANVELANLSGVNTGALLHYENLTCSVNNNKYYLSDGTTTLQVFNSLYAFEAPISGRTYNITGVYQQYNDVKEILPRSADDIEEVVVTTPSITVDPATVNALAAETDGTITVTCENMVGEFVLEVQFFESDGTTPATYDWLDAEINNSTNNVDYVIGENTGDARTAYFKVYGIDDASNEVYSELITVSQSAYVAPALVSNYTLFSGDLVEGDYIIVYDNRAMNTSIDKNRLQYEVVTPAGNTITTGDASIIWHIAKSGEYWTIYNAEDNAYAASNGTKNQAQMLADGTDDMALWSVSGTEVFEFVNKANAEAGVNSYLRNNGEYGFACYAEGTGGDLKLYKFVSDPTPVNLTATFNGGSYWATYYNSSLRYKLPVGARAFTMNADHQLYLLGEDGSVIPANTAVIIIADHADISLTNVANAGTITVNGGANILQGSNTAVATSGISGKAYVLGVVDGVLGYYEYTGTNIPATKAYYIVNE